MIEKEGSGGRSKSSGAQRAASAAVRRVEQGAGIDRRADRIEIAPHSRNPGGENLYLEVMRLTEQQATLIARIAKAVREGTRSD